MPDPIDPRPEAPPALAVPAPAMAAREAAVARLTESFARGDLSLAEFEGRVAHAYEASSTEGLTALTRDLPPAPLAPLVPLRIRTMLGNIERGGRLALPSHVEVRAFLGNVQLDWRAAQLQAGVTEIELHNFLGNIEIHLPADVRVEGQPEGFMGSFECRDQHATASALDQPTVRLTGRTLMGSVTIRVG